MEAIGCPHFDFGDPPNGFNTFIIKQGAYERGEQLVEKKMVTVTIAKQGFSNVNHHLMTAKLKTVQGSVHKKRHSYAGVACPASRPAPCTEPSHFKNGAGDRLKALPHLALSPGIAGLHRSA